MKPSEHYAELCKNELISADSLQQQILPLLDTTYYALIQEQRRRKGFFSFLRQPRLISGIYLWGSVGSGKTFLMDCFYQSLPFTAKRRSHFHSFMQYIHQELTIRQGEADPLAAIATAIAKDTLVLCFDEFLVSDVGDAMLLARLIKALFKEGVCLVSTSNTAPDELYKNGVQRISFLPAIKLIKEHTTVVNLSTEKDYRLQHLKAGGLFFTPDDAIADNSMEKIFDHLAENNPVSLDPIYLYDRRISIVKEAGTCIWFNFADLCTVPRSQADYLALSKKYQTIMLSHVPQISANARNTILLFIRLIDVLYDAKIRLIFSAAVSIEEIYPAGEMAQQFKRTCSRLTEMQSEHYLVA